MTRKVYAAAPSRAVAIFAVDPGASGAFAFRMPDGEIGAVPFTTPADFIDTVWELNARAGALNATVKGVVEKVGGFIGVAQPASSSFRFGENFGFIQGVLRTYGIGFTLVSPAKWEKAYPCRTPARENKAQHKRELRDHAARLFPSLKPTLKTADALLLLDYASRIFLV